MDTPQASAPAEPQLSSASSVAGPSDGAAPASSSGLAAAGAPSAAATTPQEEWVGIRDYGRAAGLDLSHLGDDDEKVLAALFQAYRQMPSYQQLARYGNEYLQLQQDPRWKQFQQTLVSPNPAQQAPQQPGWWNPPVAHDELGQLKARWYVQDPATGQAMPRPDAPPSVIQKIEEGERYYGDWARKVLSNPQEAFAPLIKDLAQKQFQELSRQQQTQQVASQIVSRHAPWMFQPNPRTGLPQYGVYTPDGMAFWQNVQNAERMGIRDPYDQEYYALSQLQLQRYQAMQQQAQAQQPPPNPPPAPPAHPAQRQPSAAPPGPASVPPGGGVNLASLIRRDLNANGITHFSVNEG